MRSEYTSLQLDPETTFVPGLSPSTVATQLLPNTAAMYLYTQLRTHAPTQARAHIRTYPMCARILSIVLGILSDNVFVLFISYKDLIYT